MKIHNKIIVCLGMLLFSVSDIVAQNVDLVNDKEVQELNKLNPSLTGVLNRLRFLGNASQNIDLGLETRVFKSANHLGFYAKFDNLEDLERQSFNFSYARDLVDKAGLQVKLGGNLDYQVKVFHNDKQLFTDFSFKDFNGFEYRIDSASAKDFNIESKVFDLSLGGSVLYKNLVLGVTLNHLNTPDVSVQKGIEQFTNMSVSAQLLGFFKVGQNVTVIPTAIYANQKDDAFTSLGVSINYKSVTLSGQFEDFNGYTGYDFGVYVRLMKRHLLNVSYRTDLLSASVGQSAALISATINSTLFKPKKDLEGILDKIKLVY
jgi:hypothetical protein